MKLDVARVLRRAVEEAFPGWDLSPPRHQESTARTSVPLDGIRHSVTARREAPLVEHGEALPATEAWVVAAREEVTDRGRELVLWASRSDGGASEPITRILHHDMTLATAWAITEALRGILRGEAPPTWIDNLGSPHWLAQEALVRRQEAWRALLRRVLGTEGLPTGEEEALGFVDDHWTYKTEGIQRGPHTLDITAWVTEPGTWATFTVRTTSGPWTSIASRRTTGDLVACLEEVFDRVTVDYLKARRQAEAERRPPAPKAIDMGHSPAHQRLLNSLADTAHEWMTLAGSDQTKTDILAAEIRNLPGPATALMVAAMVESMVDVAGGQDDGGGRGEVLHGRMVNIVSRLHAWSDSLTPLEDS